MSIHITISVPTFCSSFRPRLRRHACHRCPREPAEIPVCEIVGVGVDLGSLDLALGVEGVLAGGEQVEGDVAGVAPHGGDGVQVLAASPNLARLRSLDLSESGMSDAGARALAASPHLGCLEKLTVSRGGISDDTHRALAERFGRAYRTSRD